MKKILLLFAMLFFAQGICAQKYTVRRERSKSGKTPVPTAADSLRFNQIKAIVDKENQYEIQTVVYSHGTSASELYVRAVEALSDWAGPDGRSRANLDVSDRESGTVIYKGKYPVENVKIFLGAVGRIYADFTLKVRCKDGRAQITLSVPTLCDESINDFKEPIKYAVLKSCDMDIKAKRRNRAMFLVISMADMGDTLVQAMTARLATSLDDF